MSVDDQDLEPGEEDDATNFVEEDAAELLDSGVRALADEGTALEGGGVLSPTPGTAGDSQIDSDDEIASPESAILASAGDDGGDAGGLDAWREISYRRLVSELRRIEEEVRKVLEPIDPRRKRRFSGTRRWTELEEEIQEWRFGDRFDDATIRFLLQLITRRHYLFDRLRFLAGTRPTWNS